MRSHETDNRFRPADDAAGGTFLERDLRSVDRVITGAITDSSGSVVPDAKITVIHEATGLKTEALRTTSGDYRVPFLRPGAYRIEVQKTGFRG